MTQPERFELNGAEAEAEEDLEIVTLVDEETGDEQDYAILDEIEVDGSEYAILAPVEALETEAADAELEVMIMRIEGDDLVEIEDEAEGERVAARLAELAEGTAS